MTHKFFPAEVIAADKIQRSSFVHAYGCPVKNSQPNFAKLQNVTGISLEGPARSGKTSLLFQFAYNLIESYLSKPKSTQSLKRSRPSENANEAKGKENSKPLKIPQKGVERKPVVIFICAQRKMTSQPPLMFVREREGRLEEMVQRERVLEHISMKYINSYEDLVLYLSSAHSMQLENEGREIIGICVDDFDYICSQRDNIASGDISSLRYSPTQSRSSPARKRIPDTRAELKVLCLLLNLADTFTPKPGKSEANAEFSLPCRSDGNQVCISVCITSTATTMHLSRWISKRHIIAESTEPSCVSAGQFMPSSHGRMPERDSIQVYGDGSLTFRITEKNPVENDLHTPSLIVYYQTTLMKSVPYLRVIKQVLSGES